MIERNECSIRTTKFRISSSIGRPQRFYSDASDHLPGPGRYHIKEMNTNYINFAKSKRTQLFSVPDSPSPCEYNIPSCFGKGKSFTFSPRLSTSKPKYPGPGEYEIKHMNVSSARPIFGKEKRKDNFLNIELLNVPGPGKYSHKGTLEGPQ